MVWVGNWIEAKMRVDDVVGAVAVHGFAGFLGIIWVGVFAAGYPTGVNNVESSIGGQLMGLATFLPLGFLSGWFASWVLKKLNLLRVPPEVELDGLDQAEYEPDIHVPEFAHAEDLLIEPDGTRVPAEAVQTSRCGRACEVTVEMPAIINSAPDCVSSDPGTTEARVKDSADFVMGDPYTECAGFMTFGPGSTYGEDGVGANGRVHGPHLDRDRVHGRRPGRLGGLREPPPGQLRHGARCAVRSPESPQPGDRPAMRSRGDMNGKQIEFPPKQTHVRSFEIAMLAISIICVIIVLIIVLGTDLGDEFRPTV